MAKTITIRPIKRAEVDDVQNVFNHKSVIEGLGGFTMIDSIKSCAFNQRPGLWAAFDGDTPVGAFMVGGRPQIHLLKYGSVGVLPGYRRKRISTALYAACTMQGLLEGRRLFEDTIVGDNEAQHIALPTMGLSKSATLRHRTASGKSIMIYQGSLIDDHSFFKRFMQRTEGSEFAFRYYLDDNAITRDWWEKNRELASKHEAPKDAFNRIGYIATHIRGVMENVTVIFDRAIETSPQKGQKKAHPNTPALWETEEK